MQKALYKSHGLNVHSLYMKMESKLKLGIGILHLCLFEQRIVRSSSEKNECQSSLHGLNFVRKFSVHFLAELPVL